MDLKTSSIFSSVISYLRNDQPAPALGGTPAAPADGLDAPVSFDGQPPLDSGSIGVAVPAGTKARSRTDLFPVPMRAPDVEERPAGLSAEDEPKVSQWDRDVTDLQAERKRFNAVVEWNARRVSAAMDSGVPAIRKLPNATQVEMMREIGTYQAAREEAVEAKIAYAGAKDGVRAAEAEFTRLEAKHASADLEEARDSVRDMVTDAKEKATRRADVAGRVAKIVGLAAASQGGDAGAELLELSAREAFIADSASTIDRLDRKEQKITEMLRGTRDTEEIAELEKARAELAKQKEAVTLALTQYVHAERDATRALDRLAKLEEPCGSTMFRALRDYRNRVGAAGAELWQSEGFHNQLLEQEIVDPSSSFYRATSDVMTARKAEQERNGANAPTATERVLIRALAARQNVRLWADERIESSNDIQGRLAKGEHDPTDAAIDHIYVSMGGTSKKDMQHIGAAQ